MPKWNLKDAINRHHAEEARAQMGKKLKDIKDEEIGKTKEYMMTRYISDCRLQFRIRTNLVELKSNIKGLYSIHGWGLQLSRVWRQGLNRGPELCSDVSIIC